VFEHAVSSTTGQDLCQVLWLKSRDSETWLDRRTNYTRSLAVMSMVGYILGLGDRHPCNVMLDHASGKVIHIDFGDCFEVAMTRDKFPERVPFRLTRMLVRAMEVSGIEGNFRATCNSVMRVLRDNRDSVNAVLEAFVYDPLITWRLLTTNRQTVHGEEQQDALEAEDAEDARVPPTAKVTRTWRSTQKNSYTHGERRADPEAAIDETNDVMNKKALQVLSRVDSKLTGRDFDASRVLDVPAQVQRLVAEATSPLNLSQSYIGWCPFW